MGCSGSTVASSPMGNWDDFNRDWRTIQSIGNGSQGCVYEVQHKLSGNYAAVKLPNGAGSKYCMKEAMMWRQAGRHKNVLHLLDVFLVDAKLGMVMEKCDFCLRSYIHDTIVVNEAMAVDMFHQMASSIAHLHSRNIMHRDIKPGNFLCKREEQTLKLCDFGYAAYMPLSGVALGTYGSPSYMSPEMVGPGSHDLKTDVWSLGATCYRMLYGSVPYGDSSIGGKQMMRIIALGAPEPMYEGRVKVSDLAQEFAANLLHRPMATRISARQVLDLPFLNLVNKQPKLLEEWPLTLPKIETESKETPKHSRSRQLDQRRNQNKTETETGISRQTTCADGSVSSCLTSVFAESTVSPELALEDSGRRLLISGVVDSGFLMPDDDGFKIRADVSANEQTLWTLWADIVDKHKTNTII